VLIARNCLEVKLDKVLSLKPEDEKKRHPEALKWFSPQRKQIEFEVPLEELSDDDLNMLLTDDEKRDFHTIQCITSLIVSGHTFEIVALFFEGSRD
jgi:hypothetical protein